MIPVAFPSGPATSTQPAVPHGAIVGYVRRLRWRQLDIGQKLALSLGVVIAVSLALSGLVFAQSRRMSDAARINLASDTLVDCLDHMRFATLLSESAVRDAAYRGDRTAPARVHRLQAIHRRLAARARAVILSDGPAMLADFDAYWSAVSAYDREVVALHLDGSPPLLVQRFAESGHVAADAAAVRLLSSRFETIRTRATHWTEYSDNEGVTAGYRTSLLVAVSAFITILFGIGVALFIEHAITRPIRAMTQAMQALAAGDLSISVPAADRIDEVGRMAQAVEVFRQAAIDKGRLEREAAANASAIEAERARNDAERTHRAQQLTDVVTALAEALSRLAKGDLASGIETAFAPAYEGLRADFNSALVELRAMIEQVAVNSRAIEQSTRQISGGSRTLADAAAAQASEFERSAATLDQITRAIEGTAESVDAAGTAVAVSRTDAERSIEVVGEARASMRRIEAASDQIAGITALIDNIASKSNLLALNAVIEAARAGQDGKGFAVVAGEVRSLARQSADAAAEIRSLVGEANGQIHRGADLVRQTGEALERIGGQIVSIDVVAQSVGSSSRSQAQALGDLNVVIGRIDEAMRANVALVERSDAEVQALSDEAVRLGRLVSRFRIA